MSVCNRALHTELLRRLHHKTPSISHASHPPKLHQMLSGLYEQDHRADLSGPSSLKRLADDHSSDLLKNVLNLSALHTNSIWTISIGWIFHCVRIYSVTCQSIRSHMALQCKFLKYVILQQCVTLQRTMRGCSVQVSIHPFLSNKTTYPSSLSTAYRGLGRKYEIIHSIKLNEISPFPEPGTPSPGS